MLLKYSGYDLDEEYGIPQKCRQIEILLQDVS